MRDLLLLHLELSLAADLIDGSLISELRDKLISLDVNILLAWSSLGRFDISGEKLLSGLGALLLETFWIIFALVGLEELVGVGASGDDHGGVGAASEDTLVISDVLGEVLLVVGATIGVLVLLLVVDDEGLGRKSLRVS